MILIREIDDEIYEIDVSNTSVKIIRELSCLPLIVFTARELKFTLPQYYEIELKTLLGSIKYKYDVGYKFC